MSETQTSSSSQIAAAGENALVAGGASDRSSLMNFIAGALTDDRVDVHKLEALLKMQREIVHDDAIAQFGRAMAAAQREMPRVARNGTVELGGGKSYRFATWEDVDAILRPIMIRHGFSITFTMAERVKDGGGGTITGTLTHEAGHSIAASIPLPADAGPGRNNLQAIGSTLSYGKRYVAEMLFNIVRTGADDDGVEAQTRYITEQDAKVISEQIKKRGVDERDFLDFLGANSVGEIKQQDLAKAGNALRSYKPRPPIEGGP